MKAARLHKYGKPRLEIEDVPSLRAPKGEEVLLKSVSGVCQSDVHIALGEWQAAAPFPLPYTLGHELAGWVEEAGEVAKAMGFDKGTPVLALATVGCGNCEFCDAGHGQICGIFRLNKAAGFSTSTDPRWEGGYAEYVLIPTYRALINLKGTNLDPRKAAPLSDAALTPYHAIKKIRKHIGLGPGSRLVIRGIGGLGHFAIQIAKAITETSVIAVTSHKEKEPVIKGLGADHVVVETEVDLVKAVEEITGGAKADALIEMWCTTKRLAQDWQVVKPALGVIIPLGLGPLTCKLEYMTFADGLGERDILGSLYGIPADLREVVKLVSAGKITLDHVKTFSLDQINDVFRMLHEVTLWSEGGAFRATVTVW